MMKKADIKRKAELKSLVDEAYRILLENASDGILVANKNKGYVYANRKACEMLGYTKDELLQMNIRDVVPPDTSWKIFPEVVKNGVAVGEATLVRKDGTRVPVEINTTAVSIGDETLYMGIHRDLTERKKLEQKLKEYSEKLEQKVEERTRQIEETKGYLASITDGSADAIVSIDLNGVIKSWNRGAEQMLGYRKSEIIGKHYYILVPRRLRREIERIKNEAFEKGFVRNYETYRRHKDGREIPVNLTVTTVKDRDGKIIGTSGILRDITERKQAEKEIQRSKEFLNSIIDCSADAIVTTNAEGIITTWSSGAEELYGYSAEEILGKPVNVLYPKELKEERKKWQKSIIEGKALRNITTKIYNSDGDLVDISLSLAPLKDEDGNITGTVGVSKDVTERKKTEQELRDAYNRLKELDKMKDEFISNISHELRTPMTAMISSIDLLMDDTSISGKAKEILEVNRRNVWRFNKLLEDIITLSRLSAGRKGPNVTPLDISQVLDDVILEMKSSAERRKIKIIKKIYGKLPSLIADSEDMRKIFYCLLDNAIKFNREGGKVTVSARRADNCIEFKVCDTGIGIPKDKISRIFERFYQVDGSTVRKYGGPGLGLTIASELIRLYGGTISVESEADKGTTITFTVEAG